MCSPGSYSLIGASTCVDCSPGTYSSTIGSYKTNCTSCDSPSFSYSGASSCEICVDGYISIPRLHCVSLAIVISGSIAAAVSTCSVVLYWRRKMTQRGLPQQEAIQPDPSAPQVQVLRQIHAILQAATKPLKCGNTPGSASLRWGCSALTPRRTLSRRAWSTGLAGCRIKDRSWSCVLRRSQACFGGPLSFILPATVHLCLGRGRQAARKKDRQIVKQSIFPSSTFQLSLHLPFRGPLSFNFPGCQHIVFPAHESWSRDRVTDRQTDRQRQRQRQRGRNRYSRSICIYIYI